MGSELILGAFTAEENCLCRINLQDNRNREIFLCDTWSFIGDVTCRPEEKGDWKIVVYSHG